MSDISSELQTEFHFGTTVVRIIQGDILKPPVDDRVDAVVSTDDNYLTMGSGVARRLAEKAGPYYVRAAQTQCPVEAGTVIVTDPYRLQDHVPGVKHVLHGTVVDYDTEDLPLEQLVYRTTANALEKAGELGVESILFPAFATGSGGLSMEACARQMGSAIKAYLAQDRRLKAVYVILYLPPEDTTDSAKLSELADLNRSFIRETNLVLGVPYSPTLNVHQVRDFFGRTAELQRLEDIIAGKVDGKRHAVILGGPRIGKRALLHQLYHRAQQPDSPLSQGRRFAKVTFGRVHENTLASFVYQKFLSALSEEEDDADVRKEIRHIYAKPDITCEKFLEFLEQHSDHYPQVVFLIDRLPRLLRMESEDSEEFRDIWRFWQDLDQLEAKVRFIYTARNNEQYVRFLERLERFTESFKDAVDVIELACIPEQELREWVDGLYQRYLGRTTGDKEYAFFEEEAGRHPYLISLTGHAMIQALKPETLDNPEKEFDSERDLARFFQAARNVMQSPRQDFFELLMRTSIDEDDRFELRTLAEAIAIEQERASLMAAVSNGDQNAIRRFVELPNNPRRPLHRDRLQRLEKRGYLVDAEDPETAQFMATSFADWVAEYFGVDGMEGEDEQPGDVVISLLGPEQMPGSQEMLVTTLFRRRGARIITARTSLRHRDLFMKHFDTYVRSVLHPTRYPDSGEFDSLKAVGDFILDYFTTGRIRGYFNRLPEGSTISLEIDDKLKDIPWELMLEAVYEGEIPFRVGRSTVSPDQPSAINPPVRGDGKIRALLIGDPTDDLAEARTEVKNLVKLLTKDGRFTVNEEDVLIGSEDCRLLRVLNRLRSGEYGLVHYSGHSVFEDDQSAWVLDEGKVNTDDLTSSLRDAPPALVFSSSCESAEAGEPQRAKYENQAFDLPSAFLQAGVEAYVGTLWEVEEVAARRFAEAFYRGLLIEGHSLGECLRLAKTVTREPRGRINWLSFILYGDPHATPGDLFPALREE